MATYLLMLLGFVLLIKGADFLVDGASSIAKKLKVSGLVIGLTIVAFGTSTPELTVNIIAACRGVTEIAIGNIIGSNIFNILVILAISSLIFPLKVDRGTVWKEIPLTLLAAVLLGILANDRVIFKSSYSILSRIDGCILLLLFGFFMYYVLRVSKKDRNKYTDDASAKRFGWLKSSLLIIVGLSALFIGAAWVVKGAVAVASALGVSQSLVALTIVAAGTSLPELATSAVAAYKKNCDIAVGNIVGSNIFNIFMILGISSATRPLPFTSQTNVDIAVVILASLLLFIFMFTGKKRTLDRWEAVLFIIIYIAYVGFLLNRQ